MLRQAEAFNYALREEITREGRQVPHNARYVSTFGLCKIALENCSGTLSLLREENPTAAIALVRLQFEATLRGAWTRFSANEDWVQLFTSDNGGRKEPTEFPRVFEMLEEIRNSPNTPLHVYESLHALKVKAWGSFNSCTHGGRLSVDRALNGYEPELIAWMIRTTNSLAYFACKLCALVVQNPESSHRLHGIRTAFSNHLHS